MSAIKEKTPRVRPGKVLGLRTCAADMTSHGGFLWPEKGPVECPDWDPTPECGGGLHFLPWGEGDADLLNWGEDARWLVVEAAAKDVVDIDGQKSKAPRCRVVFCGERVEAANYLAARAPGKRVHGATVTAGYAGTATAGARGTATAGARGTATAGDEGTATAGYAGTATAGYAGTATAGDAGTATAGDEGTATAGDEGTATAGYAGTATAGARGTATAGDAGTATAGDEGTILFRWYDWGLGKWRRSVGLIGEGYDAGVPYTLRDGRIERKDPPAAKAEEKAARPESPTAEVQP